MRQRKEERATERERERERERGREREREAERQIWRHRGKVCCGMEGRELVGEDKRLANPYPSVETRTRTTSSTSLFTQRTNYQVDAVYVTRFGVTVRCLTVPCGALPAC